MGSTTSSIFFAPWNRRLIDSLSEEANQCEQHHTLIIPREEIEPGQALVCKSIIKGPKGRVLFLVIFIHRNRGRRCSG